jgi:hypothetical protein
MDAGTIDCNDDPPVAAAVVWLPAALVVLLDLDPDEPQPAMSTVTAAAVAEPTSRDLEITVLLPV